MKTAARFELLTCALLVLLILGAAPTLLAQEENAPGECQDPRMAWHDGSALELQSNGDSRKQRGKKGIPRHDGWEVPL